MSTSTSEHEDVYGIGAVAKLTGLTDHTIRVWERRYDAVEVRRAANGRREYTAADVEKLGLLKMLTDRGLSISTIAGLDIPALKERAASMGAMSASMMPERISVAVLGDFLPGLVAVGQDDVAPLDIRIADSNRDRLVADAKRQNLDVVVVECPTLDQAAMRQIAELKASSGADQGVIVYSFASTRDVARARDAGIALLRGPVNVDALRNAIVQTYSEHAPGPQGSGEQLAGDASDWTFDAPIAPRRFNQQQLANLAGVTSSIDCECPRHLTQLVADLSAFEIYSAGCASKDAADAALHHYLHQTTAQARALVEAALERVADAESLSY